MKRVKCQSGITGWQDKLQNVYPNEKVWRAYAGMYGLHKRLGFRSMRAAWVANPTVQGSVIPSDYRRVK